MLEIITLLSREFGTDTYVMGGGGNSSCKDEATLWIKPSGTSLAELTPRAFIAMDRARLARLHEIVPPPSPAAREALVQEIMAAAVRPATPGRASVEAPVHNAFQARYVVHTHPTLVNGLTCALGGAAAAARLFPDALWLPYTDPGYTLGMRVRHELDERRRRQGREPRLLLLENHGVFVAGDTADEIRAAYAALMATLENAYAAAGTTPLQEGPAPSPARLEEVTALLRETLGADAAEVRASGATEAAAGPVSPDHLVYAGSFAYEGAPGGEAIRAFVERRGHAPRAVAWPDGLYGLGTTARKASLALAFARDAARIRHLARTFGGVQYLSDNARQFLENWEVETYRAAQV